MKYRNRHKVNIVLSIICMILQLIIVTIATKVLDGLNLIQILIVVGVTRALYFTVELIIEHKEVDNLSDSCVYTRISSKAVVLLTTSLLLGIINAVIVGVMYKLLSLIVSASSIYLINCSIILRYLVRITPSIISMVFETKDECNLDLCIRQVDEVIKTYYNESNFQSVMNYGYGGIQVDIYNSLKQIKDIIIKTRDLAKKFDDNAKESIKSQVEFILSDFTSIYEGYGTSQLTSNSAIMSKYKEYLAYVKNNLTDLEEKIVDNKLDTLDSAVDRLKSFSELTNLEDKYN